MFGNTDQLRRTVWLDRLPRREQLERLLFTEDKASTEIVLDFLDGSGSAVSMEDRTAELRFIRPDGVTVLQTGTIEGNTAAFVISSACLEVPGGAELNASIGSADARLTVWAAEAVIRRSTTDSFADPAEVIPTLSDLLAQIDAMRTATSAANAAAANASTIADNMAAQVSQINTKATEALAAAQDATHTYVQQSEPTEGRTGDRWVIAAISLWGDLAQGTWSAIAAGTWGDLVSGAVSGEKVNVFGTWQTV